MFDLPREAHSFYIEKITDSPHLRSVLIKRFLKFVDKLKASDKTRKMFELIKHDVRSVTGRNLNNIMRLVNKNSIDLLNHSDAESIIYQETPLEDMWKIDFVKEITGVKYGEYYVDSFKRKELNSILNVLCVS